MHNLKDPMSFNPRTHSGCDKLEAAGAYVERVSIHAPTRGATARPAATFLLPSVSIHAPTRGATSRSAFRISDGRVSIHAPTRGATVISLPSPQKRKFQSTHPLGVRHPRFICMVAHEVFQSTHPLGVRQESSI